MDSVLEYHHAVCSNAALLRIVLDKTVDGMLVTTPKLADNPIIYASTGFIKLTGYDEDEILGRNCRFLQGIGSSREVVSSMGHCVKEGISFKGKLINYKKNGAAFMNFVRIEPIFDENFEVEYFVGSQINLNMIKG